MNTPVLTSTLSQKERELKVAYEHANAEQYHIELSGITKKFGSFIANDNVTLQLKHGEIHALLGENGAGKSTLMSVLFGLYTPDAGEIFMNGKRLSVKNPADASLAGIGMVHQHFKLVHNFTVLESIILGRETTKFGVLSMQQAKQKIVELCKHYKFNVDPHSLIENITVGMQQKVEILKMLYCDNEVLIFDEPTAVLTPQEIDELMKIMKKLASEGKSIIFITHKLDEIKAVADRCTVLRKGKCIGTVDVANTSKEEMSEMMVGRKVNLTVEKKPNKLGKPVLEVKNLTVKGHNKAKNAICSVSFKVHSGEILCVAGIDGNGQSELVYALTGLTTVDSGSILLNGEDITRCPIRKRAMLGMAHIPEDRHKHGMVLDYSLENNLALQTYFTDKFQKFGFLKFESIRKYAEELIKKFDIRSSAGAASIARGMSGGNQQKAIIARELDRNPSIVIAVQPVRGLDVGAIEYIHKELVAQRDAGKAVLLVSLELDEVMGLSDRIVVMHEGTLVANVYPQNITANELGLYLSGTQKGDVKDA